MANAKPYGSPRATSVKHAAAPVLVGSDKAKKRFVRSRTVCVLGLLFVATRGAYCQEKPATIKPPPDSLKLDPFYKKYVCVEGLPVVSSAKVPDQALQVAADIVNHMLRKRPDIRIELIKANIRVVVMAKTELTTDVPEHSDLKPKRTWDKRARGLGATLARQHPVVPKRTCWATRPTRTAAKASSSTSSR